MANYQVLVAHDFIFFELVNGHFIDKLLKAWMITLISCLRYVSRYLMRTKTPTTMSQNWYTLSRLGLNIPEPANLMIFLFLNILKCGFQIGLIWGTNNNKMLIMLALLFLYIRYKAINTNCYLSLLLTWWLCIQKTLLFLWLLLLYFMYYFYFWIIKKGNHT